MLGTNSKTIFLSLGSNLGNRLTNIMNAIQQIESEIGRIERTSSRYETEAWGNQSQEAFVNLALKVHSTLEPIELLSSINSIETKLGRTRIQKWEPRVIDIDIIYFGNEVIKSNQLCIPHPLMANRKFVLIPLTEIAPEFVHPILKKTNLQLLDECTDTSEVALIKDSLPLL